MIILKIKEGNKKMLIFESFAIKEDLISEINYEKLADKDLQ